MNFGGFDELTLEGLADPRRLGTIRHEFGHALALDHEHQSPKSTCEADIDWDYIYDLMAQPPEPWDKAKVDNNMRVVWDADMFATAYDPLSVMKYYFDEKFFKNGKNSKCYTAGEVNELSAVDRQTIAFMYPPSAQARLERDNGRRAAFKAILGKAANEGGAKGADLLNVYFPEAVADDGEAE